MTVYIVRYNDDVDIECIDGVYLDYEKAKQGVEELKQFGYCPWIDDREVIE